MNKIKLPTIMLWNSREGINIKNISLVHIHKQGFQPYGVNQLNVNIDTLNPTRNESHLFYNIKEYPSSESFLSYYYCIRRISVAGNGTVRSLVTVSYLHPGNNTDSNNKPNAYYFKYFS